MSKRASDQGFSPQASATRPLRVTSAANPVVKLLKSLHTKKGRFEAGLFLAEGARLALEAAESGVWPEIVAFAPAALERPAVRSFLEDAASHGARALETTDAILGQISKRDNPQTLLGAYRQAQTPLERLAPGPLVIALEGVRDPGNLGTILRTADAVGASAVVLIGQTCDPFSVEAVRATMGSIFAVPVARADMEELDAWRRRHELTMIGAHLAGAIGPEEVSLTRGLVLLMGNEQSGLSQADASRCDALVRLPMRGRADSLNLAIATSVLAYDIWRRRGYDGARP